MITHRIVAFPGGLYFRIVPKVTYCFVAGPGIDGPENGELMIHRDTAAKLMRATYRAIQAIQAERNTPNHEGS